MTHTFYRVLFIPLLYVCCLSCKPDIQAVNLACEQTDSPLGVETSSPALSWHLQSGKRNTLQTACRILVADNPDTLANDRGNCWDSHKTASDNSLQTLYEGAALLPAATYYWKVKVWDNHGNESKWSKPAKWQMGLPKVADWNNARWIALQELPDSLRIVPGIKGKGEHYNYLGKMQDTLPCFRREFHISKKLKQATAFVSGLGHFEMSVNGNKVGDHFLDPGWTYYDQYALYLTFDLTSHLRRGANACGITLGNGFYHIPRERYWKSLISFGYPKTICRILLEYADGTQENIVTDDSWKVTASPVTFASIYSGEDYDARLEQKGWDKPGFDDRNWRQPLTVQGHPLRSQTSTPLKVRETIVPKQIFLSKKGKWIYDLGQNSSGIIRLAVKAKNGQKVRIVPGELLDNDSTVTQRATGTCWFEYTAAGTGIETWQPKFSYYGFRYLMLENAVPKGEANPDGLPEVTQLVGLHTCNSAPTAGSFTCSNELFNRIFHLIDWSIRSNMASVLTDCPHREKLGWLEESHLMSGSLFYNYNLYRLCLKIFDDMREAQLPNGLVPDIAPEYFIFRKGFRDSPEWGSAYVILPWYVYQWYGDMRPLQRHYEGMKRYVDYLASTADGHIVTHGLGDWFDVGDKIPGESQLTSKGVTATAIYYYDVRIMQQIAALLKKPDDEAFFSERAKEIKEAFNLKYFNDSTGQYDRGSQAANSMALYMELAEPQHRAAVFENIIGDLKQRNYSQTPGDVGFRYFLRVLENEGASDVIFTINNRDDVPGYGYQLAKGATALTESWAAMPHASHNHFMLGHLMEWLYSGLAGIRQSEQSIAFRQIEIHPEPVGDITSAAATYWSPYGKIVSEWKIVGKTFSLNVEIPANTSALVYFPCGDINNLTENGKKFPAETITDKKGRKAIKIGSGKYRFEL
jgi:hypothetical protein